METKYLMTCEVMKPLLINTSNLFICAKTFASKLQTA